MDTSRETCCSSVLPDICRMALLGTGLLFLLASLFASVFYFIRTMDIEGRILLFSLILFLKGLLLVWLSRKFEFLGDTWKNLFSGSEKRSAGKKAQREAHKTVIRKS